MSSSSSSDEAPAVAQTPAATTKAVKRHYCPTCQRWFSHKNWADHKKVHTLEQEGFPALRPCSKCRPGARCLVARHPKDVTTYACSSCLRSHRPCSFTADRRHTQTAGGETWAPIHPALEEKEQGSQ